MAGESYGVEIVCRPLLNDVLIVVWQGRYVPMYAAAVFDRNAELVEAGIAPINLTSIMLGTSVSSSY